MCFQVHKHREARRETEEKLEEITERLVKAERAELCSKVAEDLAVGPICVCLS